MGGLYHQPTERLTAMPTTDLDGVLGDVALLVENLATDSGRLADDGDRGALLDRLILVDRIVNALNGIASDVTFALASLMEANDEHIGNFIVRRKTKWTHRRDQDAARHDGREAIVQRLALDRATGEVNQAVAQTVREAIDTVYRAYSVSMSATGLRDLGLDPDEYDQRARAGWSITWQGFVDGGDR